MKAITKIAGAVVALGLSVTVASAANVVETAESAGTFKTLLAAAQAAGLTETLATTANITVLAPSDEAFAKLPAGTVENLLKPENEINWLRSSPIMSSAASLRRTCCPAEPSM